MKKNLLGQFLLGTASLLAFSSVAHAQQDSNDANEPDAQSETDEIVVVGTQVKGANIAGELPVTVLGSDDIEGAGDLTFEDLLTNIPQAGGLDFNSTAELSNDARGDIASLNLRTLGADTSLVLVNGRRIVSHPQTQTFGGVPIQFVNMNAIPTYGLGRVEILRDGASALYGSDAISGVLNAVIRDDYEGLNARVRYGLAEGTDQRDLNLRVYGGRYFNDDRTNVSFSAQYYDRKGLDASDLDFTADADHQFDPRLSPDSPFYGSTSFRNDSSFSPYGEFRVGHADSSADGIDGERVRQNGDSITSSAGLFHLQPEGFFPNSSQHGIPFGNGLELDDGSFTSSTTTSGNGLDLLVGDEAYRTRPLYDNQNRLRKIIPDTQRFNLALNATHELNDSIELYGDFIFYNSQSEKFFGPSVLSTSNNFVIPASYYWNSFGAEMLPDGSVNPNRLPGIDAPAEGLDIAVRRYRFNELGARTIDVSQTQWRTLGGARGVYKNWDWDTAFGYSRASAKDVGLLVSRSALYAELSRSDAGALNIFDGPDITDVEAVEASGIGVDVTRKSTNTLMTWDLRASTPRLFTLPTGNVGFGWGVEWRRETIEDDRDERLDGTISFTNPLTGEFFESDLLGVSATADVAAERNVFSAYSEMIIPVFTDTGIGSATIQAAGRMEHYTDIEETVLKPRVLATWAPADQLSFRAAYSLGFRAPNLVQTSTPSFSRFSNFQEDWSHCTFVQQSSGASCLDFAVTSVISGNPDLKPETSTNLSAGIVLKPADGWVFTADYWSIELNGTVGTIPRNDQIAIDEFLRRTGQGFNPNVEREDPDADRIADIAAYNIANGTSIEPFGDILFVNETFLNLQTRKTAGFDFFGRYETPRTKYGRFKVSVNAALLTKYEQDPFDEVLPLLSDSISSENIDPSSVGDLIQVESRPKWRGSANFRWNYNSNVGVGMNARYVGRVYDPDVTATLEDGTEIDFEVSRWYRLDFYADYSFRRSGPLSGTRIRVGINNLTNNEPPLYDNSAGYSGRLHSVTPRYFYFDVRKRF
ncbi:TonB-dependent receptor [Hyphococcus formosus]|uniref:TonB-dependent receptor domain-containing protein n=1 Tax=Hyphococcus formosus TaxID=3143534 RepID=UPI00398ADA4E